MTNSQSRDMAVVGAAAALAIGAASLLWFRRRTGTASQDGPRLEEGITVGSPVIAKLKHAWISVPYVYAKVDRLSPLRISNARGTRYYARDLEYLVLAADDGWLAPYGLEWQQPGRYILMQLMSQEWVSARVAADHNVQPVKEGLLHLKIEEVDGLSSVCVQTDVAFLFTPHEKCQEEFNNAEPSRGGRLAEKIADAFHMEEPQDGETLEDALRRQRRRWVEESRTDGQYPIRSVWVHPQIKEGALNEFARRAALKKQECPVPIHPEIVMLLGPPAAGKSSIGRLKPEQLRGNMKVLRKTAASLQYREEVNNDNLTDCMPGFAFEYKFALSIKDAQEEMAMRSTKSLRKQKSRQLWKKAKLAVKSHLGCVASRLQWIKEVRTEELSAEAWALQWLTYLVYHHGPVRDSLALDIIKVSIIDAEELPVYYSSCMAGKAMGRSMTILELSHSSSKPIPHKPLAFRGFWPFTSQESRFDRQAGRAADEKKEGKLKGGNLTSNLVDIHYHAQQAETNITKMLGCLQKGVRPSDEEDDEEEETMIGVDHFLVIDNEGNEPKVLLDFASQDGAVDEGIQATLRSTVEEVVSRMRLFEKEWDAFDPFLFRICFFFLKVCAPKESELRVRAKAIKRERKVENVPKDPIDVLPMVTEIDEEIFFRKYGKRSTATATDQYRKTQDIGEAARAALAKQSDEEINDLKANVSVMRKYTCLAIMQFLKREGDWEDELIDAEELLDN